MLLVILFGTPLAFWLFAIVLRAAVNLALSYADERHALRRLRRDRRA